MNLYIFRHGSTFFSKNNLAYGERVESAEILDEGIPVIKRLAEHLKSIKTERNFTSPFRRCIQTSEIVTEITGKEFTVDNRLRDVVPEKETTRDVIKRVVEFSKEIEADKLQNIAICTHGYPINALIAYFTKGFVQEMDLENFPNPGVLVSIEGKKVSYKDFNNAG